MFDSAEGFRYALCCQQFCSMALTVVEGQGVTVIALSPGHRQNRGGIQTAGYQYYCALGCRHASVPGFIIPEKFMELQLKTHRQIVLHDPVSQFGGILLTKAR